MACIMTSQADDQADLGAGGSRGPARLDQVRRRPFGRLLRGVVVAGALIAALPPPAHASQFLDDFEGDGEVSQVPATSLRNWDIITSVDLIGEEVQPPFCHLSGSCIDLVGTAGAKTGGIITKRSWPVGDYQVGFFLYGSGRNSTGGGVASGGTVSRIQVSFGGRSIYANNNIPSNFDKFIVVHVRGSGKLRLLGTGAVANIGPQVDNVLVLPAGN